MLFQGKAISKFMEYRVKAFLFGSETEGHECVVISTLKCEELTLRSLDIFYFISVLPESYTIHSKF